MFVIPAQERESRQLDLILDSHCYGNDIIDKQKIPKLSEFFVLFTFLEDKEVKVGGVIPS